MQNYCNKIIHVIDFHSLRFHNKLSLFFAGHDEIVEKDKNDKLMTEVADLQTQLEASELENQQLKVSCKDHPWQDNEQNYG